ncbi:MerR family transcriptional regulator [Ferruginibacter sp. SUN106]|uniref:MerR family transcriptional regulator n=1 Tax=Ferruginibacter sp. SUN106 TaxID=2978348 RepID=UPI003D363064
MGLQQIAFDFDSIPPAKEPEVKPVVDTITTNEIKVAAENVVAEEDPEIIDLTEIPTVAAKPPKKNNKKQTRGRMSLKDMDAGVDLIEVPEDEVLFEKMYYSIGTVADMFKVNQSLVRFWENEFDILKPKKNGKGDRLFRPEDVKNLKLIYHLLRERKYTIEGAKDFLKNNKKADEKFAMIESLKKLKSFLNELKANL